MLTRRIVACACALALGVPAAAGARAGFDPPATTQHVAYGDTKYDLQNQQDLGPKGDTKDDLVPAGKQFTAAYGGTARPYSAQVETPAVVSSDDDTDGWQIAAVAEAGLLAAIALGGAALVGRTRPRRSATA